jgi:uroporphyrinogen-III synthase
VSLPLTGRRVLVTRAAHQAGNLSEGLRGLGAEPVEVPVLEIQPPVSYEPLDAALRQLGNYDWLILTSANTVHALVERSAALGIVTSSPSPKVAAVGSSTAQAARDAGFTVDLTPENYVAESLAAKLKYQISGKRFLLARAAVARDVIPDTLREAGAIVNVVDAYQNVVPEAAPQQLCEAIERGLEAATFTSSSSVTHLAEVARTADVRFPIAGVHAVSIGPITSQTLRDLGWQPVREADPHDIPGLIDAVVRVFKSTG